MVGYSELSLAVNCPVCKQKLGYKAKDELESFICESEGCSKTKHTFYPGNKLPGKSEPRFNYRCKRVICGCGRCELLNKPK